MRYEIGARRLAILSVTMLWWAIDPATAQGEYLPQGSVPGVKFEILPGDGIADNCKLFVVTNQTSSFVDAYVRFDYRLDSTSGTSTWIGSKWAAIDDNFPRIPPFFSNLHPGERRVLQQFEIDGPAMSVSQNFRGLWFMKMQLSPENWNTPNKCGTWDYELLPSADSLRSEISNAQYLLERKLAERDRRLKEVAEDIAKLLKSPLSGSAGSGTGVQGTAADSSKNPGRLLAEADEIAQRGDRGGAVRLLRQLISQHSGHPFAAYAADRLASLSTAASAPPVAASPIAGQPSPARSSGARMASACEPAKSAHQSRVEAVTAKPTRSEQQWHRRVMWATKVMMEIIDGPCADSQADVAQRPQYEAAYRAAERACASITSGGRCPGSSED